MPGGPDPRPEHDSLGLVLVPGDRYWGAQTQRALEHFPVESDPMPVEIIRAYGLIKLAAAESHAGSGRIPRPRAEAIATAAREVAAGDLDDHFPLTIWQSGSGTQTHMNVNEVIANRASDLLRPAHGSATVVHPNDDVSLGQSTNDTFVSAMHLAAYELVEVTLTPALADLHSSIAARAEQWSDVAKLGRTHLMDATTMTVGQEWGGYAASLGEAIADIRRATDGLLDLALGGTAVGTGINAPEGFADDVVARLRDVTGYQLRRAPDAFAAQATVDRCVRLHAALATAAGSLFKIANDIRWLGSGPRAGLGELRLPANEPGSSIMPGKVNPTQVEVMLMACMSVITGDGLVRWAGAEGNFELNAFRPIVADRLIRSIRVLGQAASGLRRHLVDGLELDRQRISAYVGDSVMDATGLTPLVGYERAARIVRLAIDEGLSVREAARREGVADEDVDRALGRAVGNQSPRPQG